MSDKGIKYPDGIIFDDKKNEIRIKEGSRQIEIDLNTFLACPEEEGGYVVCRYVGYNRSQNEVTTRTAAQVIGTPPDLTHRKFPEAPKELSEYEKAIKRGKKAIRDRVK